MKLCVMSIWTPNYNHHKYKGNIEKLTKITILIRCFIFLGWTDKLHKYKKGCS